MTFGLRRFPWYFVACDKALPVMEKGGDLAS